MQYRQGDVFITVVDSIPKGAKVQKLDQGRAILAYGEVTGHAHAIDGTTVDEFRVGDDETLYFNGKDDLVLKHEEHASITLPKLPKGKAYSAVRQAEWSDAQEPRMVAD